MAINNPGPSPTAPRVTSKGPRGGGGASGDRRRDRTYLTLPPSQGWGWGRREGGGGGGEVWVLSYLSLGKGSWAARKGMGGRLGGGGRLEINFRV